MKNFLKTEDFLQRKKLSPNECEPIAEVIIRDMEKTKFIGPWMLDTRGQKTEDRRQRTDNGG